jgi:hypothetical protein
MSGLSTDVLRAIEIERLRRAKQARLARGPSASPESNT